jgi:hypothetical protein
VIVGIASFHVLRPYIRLPKKFSIVNYELNLNRYPRSMLGGTDYNSIHDKKINKESTMKRAAYILLRYL